LAKFAAMPRASLLLGREEPRRENFTEFVLFDPRAASRAVMRTVAGKHEDLADMLPGDVDALSGNFRRERSGLVGGVLVITPV
jgi:hypothetical protein